MMPASGVGQTGWRIFSLQLNRAWWELDMPRREF